MHRNSEEIPSTLTVAWKYNFVATVIVFQIKNIDDETGWKKVI